jgi:thiol-disulfide isomerase/thioredoxin
VLSLVLWAAVATGVPGVGDPAPSLDLPTLAGAPLVPASRTTVVEFFASWCVPCQRSLDDLRALRAGNSFRLVIVAVEGGTPRLRAYFAAHPPPEDAVVVLDPSGAAARRWGEDRLPTTFFVDRRAVVRHINRGHGPGFRARATRWLRALMYAA